MPGGNSEVPPAPATTSLTGTVCSHWVATAPTAVVVVETVNVVVLSVSVAEMVSVDVVVTVAVAVDSGMVEVEIVVEVEVEVVVVEPVMIVVVEIVVVPVTVAVNEAVSVVVAVADFVFGVTTRLQADDITADGKGSQGGMSSDLRFKGIGFVSANVVAVVVVMVLYPIVNGWKSRKCLPLLTGWW
jgi:hypothetical protein